MNFIELIINNKPILVDSRSTILQACEVAGIGLSRFCYHENLSVAGNCRRCLVEVQKSPKPVVACAIPVRKGRVIFTDTPLTRKAHESVLEFLLVNHPLDCPICDQGGECDLQEETLVYGSDRGRYFEFKRSVENKECGPIVKTIRTRCIHCTRCVRFSAEVAGNEVIGRFGRGEESEIGTYVNSFRDTELSGNLVDLCPVGALTSKPYAYKARNWELESYDTVDFFDAIASNIVVYKTPSDEIVRITPRNDSIYAENWISDRTRYAFDGLKYRPSRKIFTCFDQLNLIRGSQTNLERVYAASTYIKIKGRGNLTQTFVKANLCLDIPTFYSFNRTFASFTENEVSTLIQVGTNLRYEASLFNTILRREQARRGLNYYTVGAFSSLRYTQSHQGNSLRTLFSIIENSIQIVKELISEKKSVAILTGINAFRNDKAVARQNLLRQLGKQFFVKNKSNDRLGYVHSSIGSLAFAHLGISVKKSTINADTNFAIGQPDYFAATVANSNYFIPQTFISPNKVVNGQVKTLYESTGHVRALQGQRRKHMKVINPIVTDRPSFFYIREQTYAKQLEGSSSIINLEAELISFWWSDKTEMSEVITNSFWDSLSFFEDETPKITYFETLQVPFAFNPFSQIQFDLISKVSLVLFAQPVRNFYLQDQIASTSITIADCSLYINQQTNFSKEV